jgi:hypothetical protein
MEILLKEFVEETINEVIEGIVRSQRNMLSKYTATEDPNITIAGGGYSRLEFDVIVTSTSNSETGGKAGLSIKVIDVGGNTKKATEEKAENRIKFSVLFSVSDVNNFPTSR